MIKSLLVAGIVICVYWGITGTVTIPIVVGSLLGAFVLAPLLSLLFKSNNTSTIYGIFYEKGKAGFSIAELKATTDKLNAEDRSYAILQIIDAGGVPVDAVGYFFATKGMLKTGLKFSLKPGRMSPEYIAMRKERTEEQGEDGLKAGVKEAQSHIPDKED